MNLGMLMKSFPWFVCDGIERNGISIGIVIAT